MVFANAKLRYLQYLTFCTAANDERGSDMQHIKRMFGIRTNQTPHLSGKLYAQFLSHIANSNVNIRALVVVVYYRAIYVFWFHRLAGAHYVCKFTVNLAAKLKYIYAYSAREHANLMVERVFSVSIDMALQCNDI